MTNIESVMTRDPECCTADESVMERFRNEIRLARSRSQLPVHSAAC